MNIHIISPFRNDKNLGLAYNESMSLIPDGDWAVLKDIDTLFLTPEQPALIQDYIDRFPATGLFTCFTNRVSDLSYMQLIEGRLSVNMEMNYWISKARKQRVITTATEIQRDISGFLMVLSKETWKKFPFDEMPFPEKGGCIGIDTLYGRTLRASGLKIMRMDAILMWHTYRAWTSVTDKNHLK